VTEEEFNGLTYIQVNCYIAKWVGLIRKDVKPLDLTLVEYDRLNLPIFYSSSDSGKLLTHLVHIRKLVFCLSYDFVLKSYIFGFNSDRLYLHPDLGMVLCKAICCEFLEF
jgi:hypothetical protein